MRDVIIYPFGIKVYGVQTGLMTSGNFLAPGVSHQWVSCQICKITDSACSGNARNVYPPPLVSDPDMHHGTCVQNVPCCMSGSLISGFLWCRQGNIPSIPRACAIRNFTYLVRGPWWNYIYEADSKCTWHYVQTIIQVCIPNKAKDFLWKLRIYYKLVT